MAIEAILFDLDGTLLPLEFSDFIPHYFGLLSEKFAGTFPGGSLPKLVLASTDAMVRNDGSMTNSDAFWTDFEYRSGMDRYTLLPAFERFYREDFGSLGAGVDRWDSAVNTVQKARAAGLATVLATNPVFPRIAIDHRLSWAGIDPDLFDLVTAYENMSYTKPHPGYYREIASLLPAEPSECLMVGNDVVLDLEPARAAGMLTFMVRNDYSVDGSGAFTADYEGSLEDLSALYQH